MKTEKLTQHILQQKTPEKAVWSLPLQKTNGYAAQAIFIAKDEGLKPHTSPTDAALYVLKGELIFTLDGQDITLQTDDFLTFPAQTLHAVRALTDVQLLLIR